MINRSILVAVAFATLFTGVSSSSSFARNSAGAPGAAGAAGSSSSGDSGGGGGGAGGGGTHVFDLAVLNPGPPPVIHIPRLVRVPVPVVRDARCALGPTELGYFGPERVMLTQICANEL
jgi:hypothetical protein